MLIEPEKLLMRAKKAGFVFRRMGELLEVRYPAGAGKEWLETIKRNKPALISLLQDEEAPQGQRPPTLQAVGRGANYDLFGYAEHPAPPKPKAVKAKKMVSENRLKNVPECQE
jgi:hypothetical protein